MDIVRKIYKQNGSLHHAYLLIGEKDLVLESLINFLEKDLSAVTRGNPDFIQSQYDTFGIDEARALKSATAMRAIDKMKFAVLSLNSITSEAQNSLLKIFEEPVGSTVFFVIAPTLEIFIPTLLSRFFVVSSGRSGDTKENLAKKFLKSPPAERISLLEDLIEKKDKTEAIHFLNSLEKSLADKLHEKQASKEITKEIATACEEIIKYKGFLYSRSPSIKMLLEHISCTIPLL
jgi:DNA polymerase-3 subunit delta'